MTTNIQGLQKQLIRLPAKERLKLAHWLIDTIYAPVSAETVSIDEGLENPLLSIAGMFSGGPGNTAERAEEILLKEVNAKYGFTLEP